MFQINARQITHIFISDARHADDSHGGRFELIQVLETL